MWSPQQEEDLKLVSIWYKRYRANPKKESQVFYLAGYAGVGKTTLAIGFAEYIDGPVVFGAYTGKAALVMHKKGCIGAKTIHSLIYRTRINPKTGEMSFDLNRETSELIGASLVIIDECSMINKEIARDLLSFRVPILVLGDPGQLPPPEGAGAFTNAVPDFMLTEIHRQAKDNPIIALATKVRQKEPLSLGTYGESRIVDNPSIDEILSFDQILVGRNETKDHLNQALRKEKGFISVLPEKGDKIICVKNNHKNGEINGVPCKESLPKKKHS